MPEWQPNEASRKKARGAATGANFTFYINVFCNVYTLNLCAFLGMIVNAAAVNEKYPKSTLEPAAPFAVSPMNDFIYIYKHICVVRLTTANCPDPVGPERGREELTQTQNQTRRPVVNLSYSRARRSSCY